MIKYFFAMLVFAVLLGQPRLCGCDAAAQGLDTSINGMLTKPGLKILHIGHSFTFDAVCYLPDIVKGTGADISDLCIYRTMMGGASFRNWVDTYNVVGIDTFPGSSSPSSSNGREVGVYDLQGRLLSRQPARGMYIKDGRKYRKSKISLFAVPRITALQ